MKYHSHFGVYAVVMREGKVLTIKKARGPYTGMYDLPGGSPEEGELLEEIVVREVKEETGCDLINHHQLKAVSCLYPHEHYGEPQTLRHIGVIFSGDIHGEPMQEGDGLDSAGCVWLDINSLTPQNATPFLLEGVKLVKKL